MANNRIWIKCKGCDEQILLAKTMADGYYTYYSTSELKMSFIVSGIETKRVKYYINVLWDGSCLKISWSVRPRIC